MFILLRLQVIAAWDVHGEVLATEETESKCFDRMREHITQDSTENSEVMINSITGRRELYEKSSYFGKKYKTIKFIYLIQEYNDQ